MSEFRVFAESVVVEEPMVTAGAEEEARQFRSPGVYTHAARHDTEVTLCGVRLVLLYLFPDEDFADVNPYVRCQQCEAAAG